MVNRAINRRKLGNTRRGEFGHDLRADRVVKTTHPAAHRAKIQLRQHVARVMPKPLRVLDLYAGPGDMYREAWRPAGASYVGCDLEWYRDERLLYVADNTRLLRSLDLREFNVFDLDAFGSPWDPIWIIMHRRPRLAAGDMLALCLTEGTSMRARLGWVTSTLARLAGIDPASKGAAGEFDTLVIAALKQVAAHMGGTISYLWTAKRKWQIYCSVVIQGETTNARAATKTKSPA